MLQSLKLANMVKVYCHFHCCKSQNIVKDIIYHLKIYFCPPTPFCFFFFFRMEMANCGVAGGIDGPGIQEALGVASGVRWKLGGWKEGQVFFRWWSYIFDFKCNQQVCPCVVSAVSRLPAPDYPDTANTSDENVTILKTSIWKSSMRLEIHIFFYKKCQHNICQWKKRKSY